MPNNNDKKRNGHPRFEYSKITNQVFIGTNACCTTHFAVELIQKGVGVDISLEDSKLDHPYGVEMYLWLPTEDHTPPSLGMTVAGVAALDELLKRKKKVYIHCKNGHGRGPTFFAAYLILKKGMGVEQAVALISAKRARTHIDDSQWEFLERLAKDAGSRNMTGGLIP